MGQAAPVVYVAIVQQQESPETPSYVQMIPVVFDAVENGTLRLVTWIEEEERFDEWPTYSEVLQEPVTWETLITCITQAASLYKYKARRKGA